MCENCARPAGLSRRNVLSGAIAMLSAGALPAFAAEDRVISPDEALERLMAGNARYVAGAGEPADYAAGRAARALSQRPIAAILGCADSRVSPELAFDQGPGDLFVVRVAGNFVNDDGLASLEYAVRFLETPLIMVLGHSSCGAVDAAIKVVSDGAALPGHLPELVSSIRPAVEKVLADKPGDVLAAAIRENVRQGVARLETAQPIVAELVSAGKVRVVGAHYELSTGEIVLV